MKQSKVFKIVREYLSARFPAETEEKVQKWIVKDKDAEEKERASLAYWNELTPKCEASVYLALKRVNQRTGHGQVRTASLYLRHIAAVLLPLLIIAGGYLYYASTRNEQIEVSVAYGEKKHFLLPDSSEVWLNAGTILKYPKKFTDGRRLVYLNGEACFSVKKDTQNPFIVETSELSVRVLGTRFNVKAYASEERFFTTLRSGSVEVNTHSQSPLILKPNEQLAYNKSTSQVSITEVTATDTESWTTGRLVFTNASFTEIQQTLERHYNAFFSHTGITPASKRYTIKFQQDESLDEVLNVLGEVIGFGYRKHGNIIELITKP